MSNPQCHPTQRPANIAAFKQHQRLRTVPNVSVAISGSWRNVPAIVEHDVLQTTRWIIASGYGLVTGGALGVDSIATQEALRLLEHLHIPNHRQMLTVILPTPLDIYAAHYRKAAEEGRIGHTQAEELITQLFTVKAFCTLVELDAAACNEETYYARNTKVLEAAHRLAAFQVNNSTGTQDTINKATARNMDVTIKRYKTRVIPLINEMADDD